MEYTRSLISIVVLAIFTVFKTSAQTSAISGKVISNGKPVAFAFVKLSPLNSSTLTDTTGNFSFKNIPENIYRLSVSCMGYNNAEKIITIKNGQATSLNISLSSNAATLNEVIITGVSRATLIKENPVSIVSISATAIEHTNESNIIDALVKNAPGLNAVKTGPNISKPFIRGLGYNRVLTLYDGVRQEGQQWGDEHGIEVDDYGINKAEVIKGPSSLMFGSDAVAGVVSLFPYIPTTADGKLHGKIVSEYQTNNNLIGNSLRLDYSNKNFLFVLRSSFRMAENYRNAIDERVYNTNFSERNLSILLGYKTDKGYSHFNITLYDNLQGIPDGSRDSLTRKFTKQIYEGNRDTIKNRPVVSEDELNLYRLSPLHQHIQHYRIYTHNFYRLGQGDIDALLSFQQNIRREYNHPSKPEQAGMYVRLNTVNYGFRYNAPEICSIAVSVGINGMLQNNKSLSATDFPIPDYSLIDAGIYVYAKWKKEKWTISGGLRNDVRQIHWNNFYTKTNSSTGFDEQTYFPDTANANLKFPAYQKQFHGISTSIGFTYQLSNQTALKVNAGKGYRAPNITEIGSDGLDPGAHIIYEGNRNFSPEFSVQEDVGVTIKNKNISAELNFFNNNIQDYIYLTMLVDASGNPVTDAQGNKTFQYQQAVAQVYGLEAWFSFHPQKLKDFYFDNSFAFVYGFNRKVEYKGNGINGEYLPLIPPVKIVSSITQKLEIKSKLIESITPKIETESNAAQNRYLSLNNTETFTSGYILLNFGIASEIKIIKNQTAQLQLQVNNLFDKVYQSNLSRLKYCEYYSQSPNGHSGIYNMGRNFCFKLICPF